MTPIVGMARAATLLAILVATGSLAEAADKQTRPKVGAKQMKHLRPGGKGVAATPLEDGDTLLQRSRGKHTKQTVIRSHGTAVVFETIKLRDGKEVARTASLYGNDGIERHNSENLVRGGSSFRWRQDDPSDVASPRIERTTTHRSGMSETEVQLRNGEWAAIRSSWDRPRPAKQKSPKPADVDRQVAAKP